MNISFNQLVSLNESLDLANSEHSDLCKNREIHPCPGTPKLCRLHIWQSTPLWLDPLLGYEARSSKSPSPLQNSRCHKGLPRVRFFSLKYKLKYSILVAFWGQNIILTVMVATQVAKSQRLELPQIRKNL